MKTLRPFGRLAAVAFAPAAMLGFIVSTSPAALAQAAPAAGYTGAAPDPVIDGLQIRMDGMEQSMQRVTNRMEQSGFQVTQLRRTIDAQKAEINALKKQLKAQNDRLKALEALMNSAAEQAANAASSPVEGAVTLVGPTTPATKEALAAARDDEGLVSKPAEFTLKETPEDLFKQAKDLLLKGDYGNAETAFGEFLTRYPDSDKVSEAQYWLGESLLIQEAYPEAAEAYVAMVVNHPDATKTPDALVKLARSLRMMDETQQACNTLKEIPLRYPNASAVTRSLAASERDRAGCDALQ